MESIRLQKLSSVNTTRGRQGDYGAVRLYSRMAGSSCTLLFPTTAAATNNRSGKPNAFVHPAIHRRFKAIVFAVLDIARIILDDTCGGKSFDSFSIATNNPNDAIPLTGREPGRSSALRETSPLPSGVSASSRASWWCPLSVINRDYEKRVIVPMHQFRIVKEQPSVFLAWGEHEKDSSRIAWVGDLQDNLYLYVVTTRHKKRKW